MALSEEQAAAVYEEELLRARARALVQEEVREKEDDRRDERMSSLWGDGPPSGSCSNCERPLRSRWKFCPFCSNPANSCLWCHERLPGVPDVRFCPHCGKQAS